MLWSCSTSWQGGHQYSPFLPAPVWLWPANTFLDILTRNSPNLGAGVPICANFWKFQMKEARLSINRNWHIASPPHKHVYHRHRVKYPQYHGSYKISLNWLWLIIIFICYPKKLSLTFLSHWECERENWEIERRRLLWKGKRELNTLDWDRGALTLIAHNYFALCSCRFNALMHRHHQGL